MPLSDFPRYPLTFGPSPVHRLERLTAHLQSFGRYGVPLDVVYGPGAPPASPCPERLTRVR